VLGEVDLALTRVTVTDELRDAAPVEISGRLGMPRSQVVVDADPGALPPLRVELAASVAPLARGVRVALELEPWTDEPTVRAEFTAEGISGAGVAALGRDLMTWIDGSQLTEGVAHGSIDARLAWKRRSPFDLDLRSGFAADVQLGRVELRDSPGGAVLLALDGGSAEIARVDLATGSVHAKSVELRRPELAARRTKEGVEILGLVVHPELRPSATKPAAGDEPAARAPEDSAPAARAPARGEIRVDELVVRGIDVTLRDDAADPPAVLPLDDLDVVVQRFTTRAFEEPRVVRFDAWLGAGEAQMPRPVRASNLLSGVANAVGGVLSGRDEALKYEERPVFQEALLTGRVQFVPALTGHAQATLSGFELLGFTGAAKEQGVDVGDGTVDASVRLRFRGAEGVRVDSEVVFSDLSLQEPASGPIERYLTLPVPLDTVLFLLENADGELRVPVGFTIDDEGLSRASITSAAVGATAGVIGSAIASAPLRVMSTFTDLFGITGGAEDPPPSASIAFAAGATTLSAADAAALAPLVAKMRADADWVVQVQHRLGAADVERAERLANPDPSTCRELAEGLRRRRAEIARERGELAPLVRAAWGAADARRAEDATQRLRALDAEAGNVEDALDRILDHLKPGAERHRAKRTLSAALALARARVEALREWLAAQRIEDLDERFEARPPTFDVAPGGAAGSVLAVLRERSR
jgi:hypothetical protein